MKISIKFIVAFMVLAVCGTASATVTPTQIVTIPVGKTVVWVAPPLQGWGLSRGVYDRDVDVTWRGDVADFFWSGTSECITKWAILSESMRITVQWTANLCGRVPRIELSAAGTNHPLKVGVTQTYKIGSPSPPEPEEPVVETPALDPNLLSCTYDGQPVEVELAPGATFLSLRGRAIAGPVTP